LGGSPVERARTRYSKSIDYYNENKIWEADSVLTSLMQTYVNPELLDDEKGGEALKSQIWELYARVSEEFSDYSTASTYYSAAAFSSDNYKMLDKFAEDAEKKADSLALPFQGELAEIRIDPGIIQMRTLSVNSKQAAVTFQGNGLTAYPIRLSNEKHKIGLEIPIHGGINYELSPNLVFEESKRMGVALILSTALFGLIVYNQGL
jgi:hypothetical protein